MENFIKASLNDAEKALNSLINDQSAIIQIDKAINIMADALQSGNRIFSCGNGGSFCDAMHFAEELTGRYRSNRRPFAAMAISDPSHISCVSNDFGYNYIFSRFLEAHSKKGDILLGISTSGESKNIVEAFNVSKNLGLTTILLTGVKDSTLARLADCAVVTPAGHWADRVQELHIKCIHIFIEGIERRLVFNNSAL